MNELKSFHRHSFFVSSYKTIVEKWKECRKHATKNVAHKRTKTSQLPMSQSAATTCSDKKWNESLRLRLFSSLRDRHSTTNSYCLHTCLHILTTSVFYVFPSGQTFWDTHVHVPLHDWIGSSVTSQQHMPNECGCPLCWLADPLWGSVPFFWSNVPHSQTMILYSTPALKLWSNSPRTSCR